MIKTYIKSIVYCAILLGAFGLPLSVLAQQEMSREERIKILQKLNMEDRKLEAVTTELATQNIPENLDELQIPPLSVFLDAVVENATVKKARSRVEQSKNEYLLQKRDWMNYFRINGAYGYGRYNIIGNASNEFTPMYQTSMSSAQHTFNIGASVNIPIGDIINRPQKLKKYKYDIEQLQYAQEEVMEERRLRILEAYNAVTEQLATIKAKAETAALYNAQMKISENNFIQGKIDIITLSLERGRRSGAVTNYEQSRVALHNSIILLEMLTNVKIIKDK
ncbi:TolC family protein [Bacteroides heparinolyticus]|uniref:TolC family protein n=5 Tax=Prevotella heparinolytica TaxID=28113 RepID=UPI0023F36181|nr:TolC family protein [Bacteroides heparinolyticus]MCF0254681.1 TolC family protein [Bacteroides heparinolyticus]